MPLLPTPGYFVGVPTYLYGPVPSPGVPSTLFVDLFNNQTAAGAKTWTGLSTFKAQVVFAAPAAVGAEPLWQASVDDDSNALVWLANQSGTSGQFIPQWFYRGSTVSTLSALRQDLYRLGAGMDSGSASMSDEVFQTSAAGQVASRSLKRTINGGAPVSIMGWAGNVASTVIAQAGVAEELARWAVSDNVTSFARIINGSAADNLFFPEIGGYVASTSISALTRFSCELAVDAATTAGAMVFQSRIGSAASPTALVNRTPFVWLNGPNAQMSLNPTNDLSLLIAGGGLRVREGSNAKQGVATLVAGTVTVANTSVTANSRIMLTGQDNNATGALRVSARVVGTSFTITSSDVGATGGVAYEIFEPA